MKLIIIFSPLIAFILINLFGRFFGKFGAITISIFSMVISTIWSYHAFYTVGVLGNFSYITLGTWINCGELLVNWGFVFDSLTVTMFVVVNTVSLAVHVYASNYMADDPHLSRFMSYLSFFTFFMLILVSADNLVQLFLGWEGVGLCSYLLISFWFTRVQAIEAGFKAIVMNRVGDLGLLLGILLIFSKFQSLDFSVIFNLVPFYKNEAFVFTINLVFSKILLEFKIISIICFCLFIGAVGKSAQIGLHTWLPDAMEGPTPVSALIHAATMVTAGVFLIIRCSPIFEFSPNILVFISIIGALTAFFAASVGVMQTDIKKIIAYSTCSQLGYMVFVCGFSGYNTSLFHLANHAFFKALLFLSAGAVIHGLSNEQDIRKMGSLYQIMPFTYTMILISSLALMGFPFFSGFYSKDLILELTIRFHGVSFVSDFAFTLGYLSAFFTAYYSYKLVYYVFWGTTFNGYKSVVEKSHECGLIMAGPMAFLCFGAIFSGYFLKDMFVGAGTPFFKESILILPQNINFIEAEYLGLINKLIPTYCTLWGWVWANSIEDTAPSMHDFEEERDFGAFLYFRWYFDQVYSQLIKKQILPFAYNVSFKQLDKGVFEILLPETLNKVVESLGKKVSTSGQGYIFEHACFMFFSLILVWVFFIFN